MDCVAEPKLICANVSLQLNIGEFQIAHLDSLRVQNGGSYCDLAVLHHPLLFEKINYKLSHKKTCLFIYLSI